MSASAKRVISSSGVNLGASGIMMLCSLIVVKPSIGSLVVKRIFIILIIFVF